MTFSDVEYEGKKRKTRREVFLERMDGLIPWERLEARIRPFYPKAGRGYRVRRGTIVDATIISAPSSTRNREGARDPEMHRTKKGNEWHFGMKAHIGVDAETGLTHSVRTTPANTHDLREAGALPHGGEEEVWGDSGYRGIERWVETGGRDVRWTVAMAPGRRRLLDPEGCGPKTRVFRVSEPLRRPTTGRIGVIQPDTGRSAGLFRPSLGAQAAVPLLVL